MVGDGALVCLILRCSLTITLSDRRAYLFFFTHLHTHTPHTLSLPIRYRLGIPASRSIVIEDSLIGLQAALGAKMPCIITSTPSTKGQDFSAAHAVFTELGDGEGIQVTATQLREIALGGK